MVHLSLRKFACSMGFAAMVGSLTPDMDHIFEAFGKDPAGRFTHLWLFAMALFLAGGIVAYLGGLYLKVVLNDKS